MSLAKLWAKSRNQLENKHVRQIITFAGSGNLRDGDDASDDFRRLLGLVPSETLSRYADECLNVKGKFDDSGFALQDIVNQVGSRLGFNVEHGRYRGTPGKSGHDGLWSSLGHTIVVEVKTTDTYRISLDGIAAYRRELIQGGHFSEEKSSILLVVGRDDTGELEAQIRGSRHAWDIRVISVDALLRLMRLKERVEDPQILRKISGILVPQEFTRVDGIIDLVFSAAEEARQDSEPASVGQPVDAIVAGEKKPKFIPVSFHDACIKRIEISLKQGLVRQTRATFATADGTTMVMCAVSRAHGQEGEEIYWYAFHEHQREKLAKVKRSYVAFGCGSEKLLLLIPFEEFSPWLDGMNTTKAEDRLYWHVHIHREAQRLFLRRKASAERIDLTKYLVPEEK